jgi:heat shock protein HslJ
MLPVQAWSFDAFTRAEWIQGSLNVRAKAPEPHNVLSADPQSPSRWSRTVPLNRPRRIAVVAVALCLAACNSDTPSDTTAPAAAPAPAVESTAPAAPVDTAAADMAKALVANQWQLTAATDAAGQALTAFFPAQDNPLGLLAADGRLNVTGSCNRISAGYQLLDGTQLALSTAASTMMACPQPLADADAAMASFLSGTLQFSVTGETGAPQLQLTAADGSSLSFSGTPTPETRFGGPGERAFLEVSPQPCEAPAANSCLMVRDRHFDENGLASGEPGPWRALPEGIEGYTLAEGQHQVIRVKRFEQAGSPTTVHFVYDMTVESRTVE